MSVLEGFLLGYSSFVFPAYMSYLFIIMTLLLVKWAKKNNDYTDENMEIFVKDMMDMMMAALLMLGAGNESGMAAAMGGDVAAATKSGIIVFRHCASKSRINAFNIDKDAKEIDINSFKGEVEFKNVWFRYPTRKE